MIKVVAGGIQPASGSATTAVLATPRTTWTRRAGNGPPVHHDLEPSTRQSYRDNLDRHILPTFGPMRMSSILPVHVRQWVRALAAAGVSPATIRHNKIVLSAAFTTARSTTL